MRVEKYSGFGDLKIFNQAIVNGELARSISPINSSFSKPLFPKNKII